MKIAKKILLKSSILLALILVIIIFQGCGGNKATDNHQRNKNIGQKPKVFATEKPADVFLLIDQSGSMNMPGGTDPNGARFKAAGFFSKYLESFNIGRNINSIGVINFASTVSQDKKLNLTQLTKANNTIINQNLVKIDFPNGQNDTSFINALREAAKGFKEQKEKNRTKAIIVFTDGEPDDFRKLPLNGYFSEIKNYVASDLKDVKIYIIAVDKNNKYWPRDKAYWSSFSRKAIQVTSVDENSLKQIFGDIITDIKQTPDNIWQKLSESELKSEFIFRVDPYMESVKITVLKEFPGVQTELIKPDKITLKKTDKQLEYLAGNNNLYEIYNINEPEPGNWKIRFINGRGNITIGQAKIPIAINVVSPRNIQPVAKPFKVIASFLKRDGSDIKEYKNLPPLYMGADFVFPDGKIKKLKFEKNYSRKGVYASIETITPKLDGGYKIKLGVKSKSKLISDKTINLNVRKVPYLTIVSPKSDTKQAFGRKVNLKVTLMQAGKPTKAEQVFSDDPRSLIWALVEDSKGSQISKLRLSPAKDNSSAFNGSISPGLFKNEGNYKIKLFLTGNLLNDGTYPLEDLPEITQFNIEKTLLTKIIEDWYLVLLLLGLLWLFIDWLRIGVENEWWLWRFRNPVMSGSIILYGTDGQELGNEITLSGRKLKLMPKVFDCEIPLVKNYQDTIRDEDNNVKKAINELPENISSRQADNSPNVDEYGLPIITDDSEVNDDIKSVNKLKNNTENKEEVLNDIRIFGYLYALPAGEDDFSEDDDEINKVKIVFKPKSGSDNNVGESILRDTMPTAIGYGYEIKYIS